jgi:RND family efflux transporter MFP subunit
MLYPEYWKSDTVLAPRRRFVFRENRPSMHIGKRLRSTAPALAAVLLATGCGTEHEASANASRSESRGTPVAVAQVVRQDLARQLELSAEFRPYQEIDIHAKVSGYLKAIYVDVGDRVRQGQLVALLEIPEMAQELAQASGTVRRTALEVERAKSEVKRAETAVNIRKLSYGRLANVMKSRPNLIAQQEIDDAEARYNEAEAQLNAAKAALASMEEQVAVTSATKERVQTMMEYSRITAPFAGIITERRGDPGALIQAGTASHTQAMPVVRLSQIDRLRLVLPVPESIVPKIKAGDPVEVRVDTLGRVFQGKIARFSGRLDAGTRTMQTEVDIPNPTGIIKPGMYGYATLRLDRRNDALAIPVQAVSGHGASATVMVVDGNNRLQEKQIDPGIETPNMTEVRSGLQEGDMVVLGSRSRLRPGMPVEPKVVDAARATGGH